VLAVTLRDLQRRFGRQIQVLSPAPEQTRPCAGELEVIHHPSNYANAFEKWFWRWTDYAEAGAGTALADGLYRLALKHPTRVTRQPAWLNALGTASALHLAGGGYLAESFDLRQFLRPLRVARCRHLPVTTAPLGLGPFRNPRKARAVAASLRGAKVLVRDPDSLRYCQQQGLSATEVPDDGFRWREVVDTPSTNVSDAAIGVCIFAQYSAHWSDRVEAWWVECLQSLRRSFPAHRLEGFCFHTAPEMDYDITRRLFQRAGLNPDAVRKPDADFRAAVVNLARYQAVVSSRFHAVVTASVIRLPCIAIALDDYYQTKMRGALKHARSPVSILNPMRDSFQAAPEWLGTHLKTTADLRSSSG